ncbi:porphobilinogen synthase [Streptomyces albus]|nr:porphobilinogen synthase [Streptomyces albus]
MRRMVAETRLHPADLVLPAFVREDITEPVGIGSMPGVYQHTRDTLRKAAAEAVAAGVSGIMLFGVPEDAKKDALGTAGTDPDGILQLALRDVRSEVGDDLLVMSDLCLDEFTDHGHCGVLTADGRIDNDATLERYAEMAQVQADAAPTWSAPAA